MAGCTDNDVGRLLHDYEMGWLSEDDDERFELHLMDCQYCFSEVMKFRHTATLLSEDDVIKAAIKSVEHGTGLWSRLWQLLWPEGSLITKPAFSYLVILILLPMAYMGVNRETGSEDSVRTVHAVDLVSIRGFLQEFRLEEEKDLVISFSFAGAVPNRHYRIGLYSGNGDIIHEDGQINFDIRQVARLCVPYNVLSEGEYLIIIEDPLDLSPIGTDTLRFRVKF